jgi:hypothetical protein
LKKLPKNLFFSFILSMEGKENLKKDQTF